MRGQSLLAGLGLVSLLAGCGGGSGSDTPAGPTAGAGSGNAVTVGNNFYSPATLNVATGATVTWTWALGDTLHSVTFADGTTSEIQSSGSFARTFSNAGTFAYQCKVHGAAMSGTITVSAGGATGGTGGSGMGGGTGGGGGYP